MPFSITESRSRGFSLVELLIAMTLGLILMTGLIVVFSENKKSVELNSAMANIQENARFALSALSQDIRLSSYQGCLDSRRGAMNVLSVQSPVPPTGSNISGGPTFGFSQSATTGAVVIDSDNWQPPIPGDLIPPNINPAIPGTHVLAVQFGSRIQSKITGPINVGGIPSVNGAIHTTDDLGLVPGDLALIANCDNVDLFTVSAAEGSGSGQKLEHSPPSNRSGSLRAIYGLPNNLTQTRVMRFISNVYYIGDTGLVNDSGDQIRALYQQSYPYNDANNPPSELVQGVENMRLSYGIKNENTLRYVTADDPLFEPSRVESVQIGLIMASWNRVAEQDDKKIYTIAGQTIPPAAVSLDGTTHGEDSRYRLVFNTTVKVRNRRDNSIVTSQQ